MTRYPDPFVLRENARALRREALADMSSAVAIKWRTFRWFPHASHPRKVATPAHP